MTDQLSVYVERDFDWLSLDNVPGIDVTVLPDLEDGAVLNPDLLRGADVFLSYHARVTEDTLADIEDLELIVRLGAGYDNLDLDACTEHGVVATHAPQGPTEGVAEVTVGLLLTCAFNIRAYDASFRERGWSAARAYRGRRLQRSTVGVIGLGQIGSRVVELLNEFGPEIKGYDPHAEVKRVADLGVDLVDLRELLETSDFVTIHVPRTEETLGMLGAEDFQRMPDSAYIVNTSRGGIYPDADLARAIREEWIAGAAVDVFEDEEDIEGNPLLNLSEEESHHCVFTPHSVSVSSESDEIKLAIAVDAIESIRAGRVPPNVLNPAVYDEPVPSDRLTPSFQPNR